MNNHEIIYKAQMDFLAERIDCDEYWSIYEKHRGNKRYEPWKTSKIWKENRKKKLKSACECCGSTKKLTIQHSFHPRSFKKIVDDLRFWSSDYHKKLEEHMKTFDPTIVKPVYENKKVCPHCNGVSYNYRKTMGDYRCSTSRVLWKKEFSFMQDVDNRKVKFEDLLPIQKQTFLSSRKETRWGGFITKHLKEKHECKKVFDKPVIIQREKRTLEQAVKDAKYNHEQLLLKPLATKIWIKENHRYLEMRDEDHITACGKCAYEQDIDNGLIQASETRHFIRTMAG